MVKLTAQQCFDRACEAYERAKGVIADLSAKTREISAKFDGEIAMRQFDLILQAILLNIAVEDGNFCELEKTFIENITEYGDILTTVNRDVKKEYPDWNDISWDDIAAIDAEHKSKFALICLSTVAQYADEFTYFFSAIDVIDERNYYEELRSCLFELILMLDLVDEGGYDPEAGADAEQVRGLKVYKLLFDDNWAKNTEKFKAVLEGGDN